MDRVKGHKELHYATAVSIEQPFQVFAFVILLLRILDVTNVPVAQLHLAWQISSGKNRAVPFNSTVNFS